MDRVEIEKRLAEFRALGAASASRPAHIGGQVENRMRDRLYAERVQAALAAINRPDYPAGMMLWLEGVQPELYRLLTSILPDKVHDLWSRHEALADFDAILTRLVETHRQACDIYRQHLQKPFERVLERRQEAEQAK